MCCDNQPKNLLLSLHEKIKMIRTFVAIEIDCSFSCYLLWKFLDEMNILRMVCRLYNLYARNKYD